MCSIFVFRVWRRVSSPKQPPRDAVYITRTHVLRRPALQRVHQISSQKSYKSSGKGDGDSFLYDFHCPPQFYFYFSEHITVDLFVPFASDLISVLCWCAEMQSVARSGGTRTRSLQSHRLTVHPACLTHAKGMTRSRSSVQRTLSLPSSPLRPLSVRD